MDVVLVDEGIPFVGDPYNLTLVRVKLHEPSEVYQDLPGEGLELL